MKHDYKVIFTLVLIFLLSQFMGIFIMSNYIPSLIETEDGVVEVKSDLKLTTSDQEFSSGYEVIISMIVALLIGTGLILVLRRFKLHKVWKGWFLLSVTFCLSISITPFFRNVSLQYISTFIFIGCFGLAYWKIYKSNFFIHNFTEIFMYGGLASMFVAIEQLDLKIAFILLGLISLYDMYAVWKSKHMVKLAEFQKESKVFAGLMVNYNKKSGELVLSQDKLKQETETKAHKKKKTSNIKTAILGGGDIGFPLIFTGAVMKPMFYNNVIPLKIFIIPIFVSLALTWLFIYGKKDRYYPAMPYLSAGCIVGYLVMLLF